MAELDKNIIGGLIIIALVLSGVSITWMFTEEKTVLERDGEVLGIHRWHVEAERTYINKNSWYRTNTMCPKIIEMGGRETATRCYYPSDYYEMLSRSIKRTNLVEEDFIVTRNTPQYAYGTRGAYAGILDEVFTFKETEKEIDFPTKYEVDWTPKDTRNYKLVWRVWDVKDMNLKDGNYYDCSYTFGNLKIDLKNNCDKLDRAEVKGDRIWFYFTPERGEQTFDLTFVDPPSSWCYQETANETSVCGGLDTGTYLCSGLWAVDCNNSYDGNWTTAGWGLTTNQGYLEVNYTKPVGAKDSSLWQVNPGDNNLSIPTECWDYDSDTLVLRAHSSDASNNDFFECHNSTGWQILQEGSTGYIAEEAMWWDITDSIVGCGCPGADTNWIINLSTPCITNETCDIGTGILSFNDTGSWYCNDTITVTDIVYPSTDQNIVIESTCNLKITG